MTTRIPNHAIDGKLLGLQPFTNYNDTIRGFITGNIYSVFHWDTLMAEFNLDTREYVYLNMNQISATSSKLQGRLIRNLASRSATLDYLANNGTSADAKRLARMDW